VEGPAEGVRVWVDGPSQIPAVGEGGRLREGVGEAPGGVRRHQRDRVAVAVARLELGQGASRGDKTGPNPTDRAKLGTKRHILTDQRGTPLSAVITSANTHDMKATFETLDGVVAERPAPARYRRQHLCLDKGYDFPEIEAGVIARNYVPHMRHRGELEKPVKRYRPKRWVVERSASWLNRFRKLLIRWEKKGENYLGLVQLACCITVYRRIILG
jgi:putative transposase